MTTSPAPASTFTDRLFIVGRVTLLVGVIVALAWPYLSPAPPLALGVRAPEVHALSTTTGEPLAELRGARAQIVGIEVTDSGILYAWDATGTLTTWDLAARAF